MTAGLEGVSGQQHAPAALYPRERHGTHYTGGWGAPGPVWTGGNSRPHRDSIPDRPGRSQLLYQLSYPTHCFISLMYFKHNGMLSTKKEKRIGTACKKATHWKYLEVSSPIHRFLILLSPEILSHLNNAKRPLDSLPCCQAKTMFKYLTR